MTMLSGHWTWTLMSKFKKTGDSEQKHHEKRGFGCTLYIYNLLHGLEQKLITRSALLNELTVFNLTTSKTSRKNTSM